MFGNNYPYLIKKQGVPWDCFLSYRFSHNLQTSYEITLDKTQPLSALLFYPLLTSSTIQTNRLHHLPSILSTDEELTN